MLQRSCGNSEVFGDIWWEQRPQPLNLHPQNTQRPKRKCLKTQNVMCPKHCSCVRIVATFQQIPAGFSSPASCPDPRVSNENINMYRVSPDPGEGRVDGASHRAVHTAAFHPFSSGFQAPFSAPRAALESGCFVSTAQWGQDQPPGFTLKLNFTPKLLATNKHITV